MAVQWDSFKNVSYTGSANTASWYHALGAPGPGYFGRGKNACLVIVSGMADSVSEEGIESITVDGAPVTNVLYAGNANSRLDYFLLPQSGYFTPLIEMTFSGIGNQKGAFGGSFLCYGVDQTTPIINAVAASGNSTTPSASLLLTDPDNISLFKLTRYSGTGDSIVSNALDGRHLKEMFPYNQPGDPAVLSVSGHHAMTANGNGGTRAASWVMNSSKPWTVHRCEIKAAKGLHTVEL